MLMSKQDTSITNPAVIMPNDLHGLMCKGHALKRLLFGNKRDGKHTYRCHDLRADVCQTTMTRRLLFFFKCCY